MQKLYHGKNRFLSLREAHRLLKTDFQDSEIVQIDADSSKAEQIIDLIYSPSLFITPKVYFIKRLYSNKERVTLLDNFLDIISQNSLSIIIWEDQKIRSNTKYYKFFKEHNAVEEFAELNKRTFITWAKEEISDAPITLDTNILRLLAERSNYEPERFVNNINKLKLLENTSIEKNLLDQVVADTLETDIWKLMDHINESNQRSINETLEKLLEYKVDPHYIIAMIARNLRISIQIKDLLEQGVNERKMASILKLPPFAVYPVVKAVKKINKSRILLQYKKLSNLDYEIKTGRIDPILGLSLFTLVL
jgi:DNA polymerase III subunit delta